MNRAAHREGQRKSSQSRQGLLWGSLGISFFFILFRGYVRFNVFRRFFLDDGLVLLAWILILVSAAIWQSMVDDLYLIYAVTVGALQPPTDLLEILDRYTHQTIAVSMLNLLGLWSVKAALLTLFYKLGHNVRGHNVLWWSAAIATFIGLAISIGVQNWKCIAGSQSEALGTSRPPRSPSVYLQGFQRDVRLKLTGISSIIPSDCKLLATSSQTPLVRTVATLKTSPLC